MAIVTFGSTARASQYFALTNTSNTSFVLSLLRASVAPNSTKFLNFAQYDELVRGSNLRNSNLYSVNMNNQGTYLDDIGELAKSLASGTLVAYTATYSTTGGFHKGSALASATLGDGSVTFS